MSSLYIGDRALCGIEPPDEVKNIVWLPEDHPRAQHLPKGVRLVTFINGPSRWWITVTHELYCIPCLHFTDDIDEAIAHALKYHTDSGEEN